MLIYTGLNAMPPVAVNGVRTRPTDPDVPKRTNDGRGTVMPPSQV